MSVKTPKSDCTLFEIGRLYKTKNDSIIGNMFINCWDNPVSDIGGLSPAFLLRSGSIILLLQTVIINNLGYDEIWAKVLFKFKIGWFRSWNKPLLIKV